MTLSPWSMVGFFGQALFFSRFLVQWIASEREGRTTVPTIFWWFSLCGGSITLVYALGNRDAPIALGQCVGLVVYVRNLMLVRKEQRGLHD